MGDTETEEEPSLFTSRLGIKTDYKLALDKDIKKHLMIIRSFKPIKAACFFCRLTINENIYFCEKERIFMCKECCIKKHKVILTDKESEHADVCVELEHEEQE